MSLKIVTRIRLFVSMVLFALIANGISSQEMSNNGLYKILVDEVDSLVGIHGAWSFNYEGYKMLVLTDEGFNRMRIISPIDVLENLGQEELINALTANFHSALDVKYAISDGLMWSVFIHPLKELSDGQVRDALSQVARAVDTFGTSYSSTDLVFPGPDGRKEENDLPKGKNKKM